LEKGREGKDAAISQLEIGIMEKSSWTGGTKARAEDVQAREGPVKETRNETMA